MILHPKRSLPLAFALVLMGPAAGLLQAQVTTRASVSTAGVEGNGLSTGPALSLDGRYASFASSASNLVSGDTNGVSDVFVHDGDTGETARVSLSSSGQQADAGSGSSALSADGRFVAFSSTATNLVAGDTNGVNDVFVHDRQTGETARVSVSSGGVEGDGSSHSPRISADGRYVVFESAATNLVPFDTNGLWDVFVHDRDSGETRRVSVSSMGAQSNGDSRQASISASGDLVAFVSSATTLVSAPAPLVTHIYVHELETGVTSRVSVSSAGVPGNDNSLGPSLSGDGRYVAFSSFAGNLDPTDQTASEDVFVHDRVTGQTQLVSRSSTGVQANSWSFWPAFSADGRYVGFVSDASNLVPGDTNARRDVFVRDLQSDTTTRVSVSSLGAQGDGHSGFFSGPSLSGDGRRVGFMSLATNLVADDTNGVGDAFVHDRSPAGQVSSFCSGDGSGAPCPCGNSGSPGHGCGNSTFGGGTELTAAGSASVSADTLVLAASSSAPDQPGIFFQGALALDGGNGVPFGDGLRCVDGNVVRLELRFADAGGSAASTVGLAGHAGAGQVVLYQWWYRDPGPLPCGSGLNFSNALEVTWAP